MSQVVSMFLKIGEQYAHGVIAGTDFASLLSHCPRLRCVLVLNSFILSMSHLKNCQKPFFLKIFSHFEEAETQTGCVSPEAAKRDKLCVEQHSTEHAAERKLPLPVSCCFLPSSYTYTNTRKHNLFQA